MPHRDTAPVGAPVWIELCTSDPDRSRAFYGDLFGWDSQDMGPEFGNYITFTKGGEQIAGGMRNDGQSGAPDTWTVYLKSDDAAAVAKAAAAHGGQVVVDAMPVMELGTMAVVVDAGQAAVGAWQPGIHTGFGLIAEAGAPSWFELFTRDYDASIAFYQDVFGWKTEAVGDTDDFRYTTMVDGGEQYAGVMDASGFLPEGVPAHWSVYFGTDDADATAARIVELGGSIVSPPEDTPYGRLATATDPVGVQFKLVQGNQGQG
jgi:predicted enzyme related to lactoylglutathione lyase